MVLSKIWYWALMEKANDRESTDGEQNFQILRQAKHLIIILYSKLHIILFLIIIIDAN